MARDDYYTLVAKILVFLYKRMKGIQKTGPEEYIVSESRDFPVSDEYLVFVLDEMKKHSMIQGITIIRTWGDVPVRITDLEYLRITQEGIDYLRENSTIRKVAMTFKDITSIAQLFT